MSGLFADEGMRGGQRRQRLDSDPRTPMAWQHRDNFMRGDPYAVEAPTRRGNGDQVARNNGVYGGRSTPVGSSSRYGGPPTPSSAHSRTSRTPDHNRDTRGSSSDRYSHQSTRKLTGGRGMDGRSQTGSRTSRSTPGRPHSHRGSTYARSQPSPSSTEETAEETTETDSQAPLPDPRQMLQIDPYQQPIYHPAYAVSMAGAHAYPAIQPQIMGPVAPPQLLMAPNGSIRSVQSVPMLATAATAPPMSQTWDGEPCPVHHQHGHHHQQPMPLAALYGMGMGGGHIGAISMGPSSVPPSIISGATTVRRARSIAEISNSGMPYHPMLSAPGTPHIDSKSFHGSMHIPHNMAYSMRGPPSVPHPRMVFGENGAPSHLPMRESKSRQMSPLPPKDGGVGNGSAYNGGMGNEKDASLACCSGHFVVIWIILGIITFGILLGIVLKFTVA